MKRLLVFPVTSNKCIAPSITRFSVLSVNVQHVQGNIVAQTQSLQCPILFEAPTVAAQKS